MTVAVLHELERTEFTTPSLPRLRGSMRRIKAPRISSDSGVHERLHFKCMACDAEALIPPGRLAARHLKRIGSSRKKVERALRKLRR